MDLITHIPGVGPTAAFNPGATTPAPYNGPHTGALDGTGPGTATKNVAELYNRNLLWRRALIAAAGLAFDPTNWVQEVQAVQLLISAAAAPPGDVHYFAQNTAPAGYLKANGALISRGTYANLFAAIGTTFGVGDGATTFALPDLRGEFVRGWDDGRGIDASRVFGSAQKGTVHSFDAGPSGAILGDRTGSTGVGGVGHVDLALDYDAAIATTYPSAIQGNTTGEGGSPTFAAVANTSEVGAGVIRPRNIALLACIKY